MANDLMSRGSNTAIANQNLEPVAAFSLLCQNCGSLHRRETVVPFWQRCGPVMIIFIKLKELVFQLFYVFGKDAARAYGSPSAS